MSGVFSRKGSVLEKIQLSFLSDIQNIEMQFLNSLKAEIKIRVCESVDKFVEIRKLSSFFVIAESFSHYLLFSGPKVGIHFKDLPAAQHLL